MWASVASGSRPLRASSPKTAPWWRLPVDGRHEVAERGIDQDIFAHGDRWDGFIASGNRPDELPAIVVLPDIALGVCNACTIEAEHQRCAVAAPGTPIDGDIRLKLGRLGHGR